MAISNRDRVRKGLDELKAGLVPFVERELRTKIGRHWVDDISSRSRSIHRNRDGSVHWDIQAVLKAMVDNWQSVFRSVLGYVERSYVGELIEVRNSWAHEKPFKSEDVYRALDTMERLLRSVSEGDRADIVAKLKADLNRQVFEEQARNKVRYQTTLEGMPKEGLRPWREVLVPHADVASGTYMQAEFAADLSQVHKGEGSPEYQDPQEFYRRTFVTGGLRDLLCGALERLTGGSGDPVLELQTNFGGGKTHSMLALYHLFSGVETASLEGIDAILADAGVDEAPRAHRAVLVGTALSPGDVNKKDDGTEVRTLWGEMAHQLGGAEGYGLVSESDRRGTSPGSDDLAKLLERYSPCLVLVDEWIAYARQLVGKQDLPAGTFEAQDSFAQALTEAARKADKALVVAAIPSSRVEIGGEAGAQALDVLKNVFQRVAKPWRPATGDEGFEIVRRRLFEPISGRDNFAARDAVINAFVKMYSQPGGEFPQECMVAGYRDHLVASYPLHPELFRRLYEDWSTLDRFQRTRGVLRLLAKVIHRLWEGQDRNLLIMPSMVPMDDHAVKSELTRYLPDVWEPIISQDVDGPNSLPLELDQQHPNLNRYSACRRVARALYIGTAPGADGDRPGIGSERIHLACAQPGETAATFADALRRVSARGRYIHQDGNRYWLSTRPNLNRTASDRAGELLRDPPELHAEIIRRMEADRSRGDFKGVHICPGSSSDVPDDTGCRLVIVPPDVSHRRGQQESAALESAADIVANRGTSPRLHRNTLVFLAADERELDSLLQATADFLAWKSILADTKSLNLDEFQKSQAQSKQNEADSTVDLRITATWIWALAPAQSHPAGEITWEAVKVSGSESLAVRAAHKLQQQELLMPAMGGVRLRMALERAGLWADRNHVTLEELAEWFPRYLYLPRVRDRDTLIEAIRDGAMTLTPEDTFAVAEAYDEAADRYLGLSPAGGAPSVIDNRTCVVKTDVARAQLEAEAGSEPAGDDAPDTPAGSDSPTALQPDVELQQRPLPTSFVGSVTLDGERVGRSAGQIADEVISHLGALPGARVKVAMEIHVRMPQGADERVVRTVSENASTLKFDHVAFEDE